MEIHPAFAAVRDHLGREGKLGDRETAFFSDSRLAPFWSAATACMRGMMMHSGYDMAAAAASIVGAFLTPLSMGYGATENRTGQEPKSFKARNLASAARSNALRPKAIELAQKLADHLDEIGQEIGAPDALKLWVLAQSQLPVVTDAIDHAGARVPSYAYHARVSDALRHLADALQEPVSFKSPGMLSKKVTWRDWLREARANAAEELDPPMTLRETDWVVLVQVLLAPNVSRDAVKAALRESME